MHYYKQVHIKTKNLTKKYRLYKACEVFSHYLTVKLPDGLLDNRHVEDVAERTWNYVAVGCGKDLQWWKEFFSVLSMVGYKGVVSLEMEDLTMSVEAGVTTSIEALEATISK